MTGSSDVEASVETQAHDIELRCGFAAFRQRQAVLEPLGTALIVLAFAAMHFGALVTYSFGSDGTVVGSFLDRLLGILTKEFVDTNYAQSHVVAMTLFFIVLIAGIAILRKAHEDDAAFRQAHPYLRQRTDEAALQGARARGGKLRRVGIVLIVAAIAVQVLTQSIHPQDAHNVNAIFIDSGSAAYEVSDGITLTLIALAVWFMMHGNRIAIAPSYELYNLRTLVRRSVYDIAQTSDEQVKPALLVAKDALSRSIGVGHGIVAVAVFLSACMFFLPSFETPLWWVPLVAGFAVRDIIEYASVMRLHKRFGKMLAG